MSIYQEPPEDRERGKQLLKELIEMAGRMGQHNRAPESKLTVNKRTHRIRFENETKDQVTIVIERRKN